MYAILGLNLGAGAPERMGGSSLGWILAIGVFLGFVYWAAVFNVASRRKISTAHAQRSSSITQDQLLAALKRNLGHAALTASELRTDSRTINHLRHQAGGRESNTILHIGGVGWLGWVIARDDSIKKKSGTPLAAPLAMANGKLLIHIGVLDWIVARRRDQYRNSGSAGVINYKMDLEAVKQLNRLKFHCVSSWRIAVGDRIGLCRGRVFSGPRSSATGRDQRIRCRGYRIPQPAAGGMGQS